MPPRPIGGTCLQVLFARRIGPLRIKTIESMYAERQISGYIGGVSTCPVFPGSIGVRLYRSAVLTHSYSVTAVRGRGG